MLEETATVVKTVNQDLWVRTDRQTVCNGCAANKGCGISLIDKIFKNKPALLHVKNDVSAQVGDKIVVGIEGNAFLRASLLVYFIPLAFMMGFALLGHFIYLPVTSVNAAIEGNFAGNNFAGNNGVVIIFALLGLLAGFVCVYVVSKKLNNNDQYRIRLLKKVTGC